MLVEITRIGREEITVVSSLDVAATFEKEHYHVMEDIRRIVGSFNSPEIAGIFRREGYAI